MCRSKPVPIIEGAFYFCIRGENMYLALYRKYRPRTFDDVVSQSHITTTLKNQIASGTTGHAYLFTGSRGTGKTTCAKIFAMAVNCQNPKDGNPCLECDTCREILSGASTDIVEMDAASNNGIDDVRQLRDEVLYAPVSCKYRVYIIDEVHNLSGSAFNALLKTIEEPPPHVKFILATTEAHKVLATITSRCQRFEFRRVNPADSTKRLLYVASREGVRLEEDAAELISRLSDGGMRDALSILDRCISADKDVTTQLVRDCVGAADNSHLASFAEMTAQHDAAGCIRLLEELYKGSKDIVYIIDDLSRYFRDLMLCKTTPDDRDLLYALPYEQDELFRIAEMFPLGDIFRCLSLLRQCADDIGRVRQRRTVAEMCLVKMCTGAEVSSEAPRVTQTAPAAPRFREVPAEPVNFTPKPEEQLTPAEKVNLSRTRALIEENTKRMSASAPSADPPAPQKAPLPPRSEMPPESSFPAPPADDFERPPFEDLAPPPGDSFYSDSYPMDPPEEPEPPTPAPEPPKTIPAPEPKPEASSEPEPEHAPPSENRSITPEEWNNAVSRTSYLAALLLKDSTASFENGVLVVRSSNKMLVDNVKGDEILRYDEEISKALGYSVHIKILPAAEDTDKNKADETPLGMMLNKARELGVSVDIND